jgi:Xaa-Pro aminopeptidase
VCLTDDKSHVLSPQPIIEMQRLIKTPVEIELMRTGANLSALSFIEVLLYQRVCIDNRNNNYFK